MACSRTDYGVHIVPAERSSRILEVSFLQIIVDIDCSDLKTIADPQPQGTITSAPHAIGLKLTISRRCTEATGS